MLSLSNRRIINEFLGFIFFSKKQTVHHGQRDKVPLIVLTTLKRNVKMQNTVYLSVC